MRICAIATLCFFTICGCKGTSPGQNPAAGTGGAADKTATTVYSMEVANRCAGFDTTKAAEFLAVPAADVEEQKSQITPTTRGCSFTNRVDQTRKVSFSISRDDSVDEAKHSFASYRETVTIGSRVQQSATGQKPAEGAYVDILGVGDEAIWSHTNETLAVRRGNLTIMVMAPNDKKQQAAVAQKVLAGL